MDVAEVEVFFVKISNLSMLGKCDPHQIPPPDNHMLLIYYPKFHQIPLIPSVY